MRKHVHVPGDLPRHVYVPGDLPKHVHVPGDLPKHVHVPGDLPLTTVIFCKHVITILYYKSNCHLGLYINS